MPSHLALLSCLLVLLLSLDKFLLHYLKKRLFSGPRIPTGTPKSRRSMAAAAKWSETAMLVIDMQVFLRGDFLSTEKFAILDFELFLTASCFVASFSVQKDFVDPGMRSPMLVAGGEAVVPAVAEAVAVARQRGIFLVWVSSATTNSACPGVISAQFLVLDSSTRATFNLLVQCT